MPLRFASEAWPRAGLGEPRSASNANKPASSWPLKQGRKKCSKHGCDRGTSTVATIAVPEDPLEALRGGLILTLLLGCRARTPLDWTHAWAMLGEWAGKIAFPLPENGKWPRHGHGIYLRPDYIYRTPPFLTWARPIFEQGALSPMSVFPADFPILCLPGDKLFQSKDVEEAYCLPPVVHAFHGNKVDTGKKLRQFFSVQRLHGFRQVVTHVQS